MPWGAAQMSGWRAHDGLSKAQAAPNHVSRYTESAISADYGCMGFVGHYTPAAPIQTVEDERQRQREELRRTQLGAMVRRAHWPEFSRADLTPLRFGLYRHTDGRTFKLLRGEPAEVGPIVAWFKSETGAMVFLERGPGNRR